MFPAASKDALHLLSQVTYECQGGGLCSIPVQVGWGTGRAVAVLRPDNGEGKGRHVGRVVWWEVTLGFIMEGSAEASTVVGAAAELKQENG